jgi:predicted transcriptional regulator
MAKPGKGTTEKPRETLAETLRRYILESGIPLGALSRKADIPQSVLHRFAHDERAHINTKTADRIMVYFNLEVRER